MVEDVRLSPSACLPTSRGHQLTPPASCACVEQLVEAGKHGAGGGSFGLAGEYLALEMIENRCASQVGKFIKGSHLMATIGTVVHLGDTTGTSPA